MSYSVEPLAELPKDIMNMTDDRPIIITSGGKYSDIDTLACAIAYKELLDIIGIPSETVLPGKLNESVSRTVRTWKFNFSPTFDGDPYKYHYVLVDISEPKYFAGFVVQKNIIEIYDHRWGFEEMWKQSLGPGSHIEIVGSCATLIWERLKHYNILDRVSHISADLLYTAILSNTLNFKAQVTTQRDIDAYKEISEYSQLQNNWSEVYFNEIEEDIMKDPVNALKNDTKETSINGIGYKIGQLELWDNTKLIQDNKKLLLDTLKGTDDMCSFITFPNISQGFNYILSSQKQTKEILTKVIGAEFEGDLGKTDRLWLRKEILRELRQNT